MNSKVAFTILALLVLYSPSALGRPVPEVTGRLRCQCINYVSKFIPLKQMADVDIFPSGPHCSSVEIIATLKNGKKVCLLPEAPWVKKMVDVILGNN